MLGGIAWLALIGLAPCALAKTVYIRDTLYVPLRGGQSSEHRILHRGLRSGTRLELLDTNEETEYSLVRLEDGMEGWIQTQYLVDEPIAADLLAGAQEKVLKLEADHQRTLLRLETLETERDDARIALETTRSQIEDTTAELEKIRMLAADVISIDERNEALIDERAGLEQEINSLLTANDNLKDQSAQEWFVRGGGLVLIALLVGFLVGRRIYNRRSSGWA